jgi:hypothetical protein
MGNGAGAGLKPCTKENALSGQLLGNGLMNWVFPGKTILRSNPSSHPE